MQGGEVEVVGGGLGRLPGRVELAFCSASALTCRAAAVLQPPSAAPLLLFFLLLATMRVKSVGIALECFAFRVHIIRARALLTR